MHSNLKMPIVPEDAQYFLQIDLLDSLSKPGIIGQVSDVRRTCEPYNARMHRVDMTKVFFLVSDLLQLVSSFEPAVDHKHYSELRQICLIRYFCLRFCLISI